MDAPTTFTTRLAEEFNHRLRLRWSNSQQAFHIEQKIGPHREAPIDTNDDDMVRARDGFVLVMEVRGGDRMPCPECRTELHVPLFETAQVICDFCRVVGRNTSVMAGYFPLNDRLLDHLRKCDPERDGSTRLRDAADRNNEALTKSMWRKASNHIEAGVSDHYEKLVGIPRFSYGGIQRKVA